ncbi:MAG: aminotransferase class I/II-fold pyridoxal phosphate-dependent enzyme [Pseudoclavibacter sp.]|nr:aminotransferase class I/II-fold pyridoxal phosphate-dependent enzyme [Pseudoclavibacter sp.]
MDASGPWRATARGAGLLGPDGTPAPTVFAETTELADRAGAVNLGQGFPDEDGPAEVLEAAVAAIRAGRNQYAPARGLPELRAAVADHRLRRFGVRPDPEREVLATAGASEGIAAAMLAFLEPGDEVVTVEPYYDAYAALAGRTGARLRTVPLRREPVSGGFRLDPQDVRAAFGPATRMVVVNTPHNPSGMVLDRELGGLLVELAAEHDAIILSDEVYEELVYEGAHLPIAALPGARERTITVSSGGKTFSTTGWKIGWLTAPAELATAVLAVKQYLSFANGTPFQHAIATGLRLPDEVLAARRERMRARRDLLCQALEQAGLDVVRPQAGYFVCADARPLGVRDAAALCRAMPERIGVAAVPLAALCARGGEGAERYGSWLRFAFCKREEVLREAARRLAALSASSAPSASL